MIKDTLTYDIVGSFLRPAEIKEARKAYKDGKITKEELTQAEDLAIASLVEKEVAHGLKYVTDGEFRRRWWHLDWLKEFDGFDTIHFTKEINGTSNEIELGTVTGKFFYDKNKAHPELCAWDYLHSLTQKYDGITAKKCISGPIIFGPNTSNTLIKDILCLLFNESLVNGIYDHTNGIIT